MSDVKRQVSIEVKIMAKPAPHLTFRLAVVKEGVSEQTIDSVLYGAQARIEHKRLGASRPILKNGQHIPLPITRRGQTGDRG
jgi:hypothetical protein